MWTVHEWGESRALDAPPSWSQQHLLPYTDCHSSRQQQAPYAHDKDRRASTAIRSRCAKGRATTTMGCTREKRRRMGHLQSPLPSICAATASRRAAASNHRAPSSSRRARPPPIARARLQSPPRAPASTSHLQSPERWPPIDG